MPHVNTVRRVRTEYSVYVVSYVDHASEPPPLSKIPCHPLPSAPLGARGHRSAEAHGRRRAAG